MVKDLKITGEISDTKATVMAKEESSFSGQIDVTYTIAPDLSTVLKNTNIGTIKDAFDLSNIKKLVLEKNPELKDTDINVPSSETTNTNKDGTVAGLAPVEATSDSEYSGEVRVYFLVGLDLAKLISENEDLGKIDTKDAKDIKKAITDKHKEIKDGDITITNIENSSAKVIPSENSKFYGERTVKFTVRQDLMSIIPNNSNLGELAEANEDNITAAIIEKFKLDAKDFTVGPIREGKYSTISATEESNYKGTTDITFSIKRKD